MRAYGNRRITFLFACTALKLRSLTPSPLPKEEGANLKLLSDGRAITQLIHIARRDDFISRDTAFDLDQIAFCLS